MLWYCGECTTAYSVGAPHCPHCGQQSKNLTTLPATTGDLAEAAPPEPKPRRRGRDDG